MKQYIEIRCRHCESDDLVKNGRSENGTQRYRCNKFGKSFQHEVNPHFMAHLSSLSSCELEIEIHADAEADKFWSYVRNKKNQRWTWYAVERKSGIIMAWQKNE